MSNITSKYRSMLDSLHKTARQVVMDEIEGDVNRMIEYSNTIDENDPEQCKAGFETIVAGLKELAQKVY